MAVIDEVFMNELRERKTGLGCPICAATMTPGTNNSPEVHHRLKRGMGGGSRYDVPEVCVVICKDCNRIKVECWSREKFIETFGQRKYDYYVKGTDIKESELKLKYPDKIERRIYTKQTMPYGKKSKWKKKLNGEIVRRV